MKGEFDELRQSILSREHIRFNVPRKQLPYRPKDWLDDKNNRRPFRRERVVKRLIFWIKLAQQLEPNLP